MSPDTHATTVNDMNSSGLKHPYHLVDPARGRSPVRLVAA